MIAHVVRSTTSLARIVVAETSYQMLEVSSLCDRKRAKPLLIKITVLTNLGKKSTMKLSGVSIFFSSTRKNFKSNHAVVVKSFSSSNLKVSNNGRNFI